MLRGRHLVDREYSRTYGFAEFALLSLIHDRPPLIRYRGCLSLLLRFLANRLAAGAYHGAQNRCAVSVLHCVYGLR